MVNGESICHHRNFFVSFPFLLFLVLKVEAEEGSEELDCSDADKSFGKGPPASNVSQTQIPQRVSPHEVCKNLKMSLLEPSSSMVIGLGSWKGVCFFFFFFILAGVVGQPVIASNRCLSGFVGLVKSWLNNLGLLSRAPEVDSTCSSFPKRWASVWTCSCPGLIPVLIRLWL